MNIGIILIVLGGIFAILGLVFIIKGIKNIKEDKYVPVQVQNTPIMQQNRGNMNGMYNGNNMGQSRNQNTNNNFGFDNDDSDNIFSPNYVEKPKKVAKSDSIFDNDMGSDMDFSFDEKPNSKKSNNFNLKEKPQSDISFDDDEFDFDNGMGFDDSDSKSNKSDGFRVNNQSDVKFDWEEPDSFDFSDDISFVAPESNNFNENNRSNDGLMQRKNIDDFDLDDDLEVF